MVVKCGLYAEGDGGADVDVTVLGTTVVVTDVVGVAIFC